jgi:Family of unknown function (DUF6221)
MSDAAAGHLLHNIFAAPAEPGPPYTHTFSSLRPDPAEAVTWLRKQIEGDKAAAEAATPGPWAWEATGEKDSSWAVGLVQDEDGNTLSGQIEPGEGIIIDGVCEGIDGNLADAAHIGLHNPAGVIADCEAKLAILDNAADDAERYGEESLEGRIALHFVDLLASAYRHREGYARYWGTPASHTLTEG